MTGNASHSRVTFSLTDPAAPEADTSLTVTLGGEEIAYQIEAFRRFLLAQQFAETTINRHLVTEEH